MNTKTHKIKIIFVITKSNFGGAQKYVYDFATNLPQSQFEVLVVLGGSGLLRQKLEEAGVPTITLPSLTRDVSIIKDLRVFIDLVRIFKKEKPAVVHLNSSKIGIMGGLAGRLTQVSKIIFTAHGWAFNENRSHLSRIVIKILSWFTVLLSHKTIAVSEQIAKDMPLPFTKNRILIIKNSVRNIDFLSPEKARASLGGLVGYTFPEHAFLVGTIAELHPNKGLLYGLEAFASLAPTRPSLYYVIIGEGESRPQLESFIKHHGLEKRVFLAGFVDQAPRHLKAFDCFLLPSITEGFCYVLLEAGLAGIPVVASKVGGIPEIIQNSQTGLLVSPRSPQEIASAITGILKNPELGSSLGVALEHKVATEFSFEQNMQSTVTLYTQKP